MIKIGKISVANNARKQSVWPLQWINGWNKTEISVIFAFFCSNSSSFNIISGISNRIGVDKNPFYLKELKDDLNILTWYTHEVGYLHARGLTQTTLLR